MGLWCSGECGSCSPCRCRDTGSCAHESALREAMVFQKLKTIGSSCHVQGLWNMSLSRLREPHSRICTRMKHQYHTSFAILGAQPGYRPASVRLHQVDKLGISEPGGIRNMLQTNIAEARINQIRGKNSLARSGFRDKTGKPREL